MGKEACNEIHQEEMRIREGARWWLLDGMPRVVFLKPG